MGRPGRSAALGLKLLELSRLFVREDRCDEAEAALLRAAETIPEEVSVYSDLAGLRLKGGRFDDAARALESGLEHVPAWTEGRLELARIHLRQARFAQAERELERLSEPARAAAPALALSARLATHCGDLPLSALRYRRALDADPRSVETALNYAEVLFRLGRDKEALATLRATPSSGDISIHELSREFRRAFFAQAFEEAFSVGERILDETRHPDPIDALRWPAVIDEYDLTYPGKRVRARAVAALAVRARRHPRDPWAAYFLYLYRMGSDRSSAGRAAVASRCLARYDQRRYGWMRLECAKSRLYAGDFEGALRDFHAAAGATEPPHWMALCHEGETLVCLGRVDEGLSVMDRAVGTATPAAHGNALGWKGEMLLWVGRYEEALSVLETARARGAQYAHTWIGGCLLKLGRPGEALEVLDRAVALSFGDHEAKMWRAETLLALGRFDDALRQTDEAMRGGEWELWIYRHSVRGLARAGLGDAAGMRLEASRIPRAIAAAVRKRAGLAGATTDESRRRTLEEVLSQGRGVRRGGYAMRAWLGFVSKPTDPGNSRVG